MAKIIQILDVNSEAHRVRLDDGRVITIDHGHGDDISVGAFVADEPEDRLARMPHREPEVIPPSIEHLNSPEQVQANILSEIVQPHEEQSHASSEPSPESSDGDRRTQPEQIEGPQPGPAEHEPSAASRLFGYVRGGASRTEGESS